MQFMIQPSTTCINGKNYDNSGAYKYTFVEELKAL
jgi:hypothetical protein